MIVEYVIKRPNIDFSGKRPTSRQSFENVEFESVLASLPSFSVTKLGHTRRSANANIQIPSIRSSLFSIHSARISCRRIAVESIFLFLASANLAAIPELTFQAVAYAGGG